MDGVILNKNNMLLIFLDIQITFSRGVIVITSKRLVPRKEIHQHHVNSYKLRPACKLTIPYHLSKVFQSELRAKLDEAAMAY